MSATTIGRTAITDDDGTGTTGTILNNAWKQELYNQVDALLANALRLGAELTLDVNNKHLQGKTTGAVDKKLIGVNASNKVALDTDALGAVFGSNIIERNRSFAIGEWTDVTFAAGNFTGNASMTWTVQSGDQVTFAWTVIGKTMIVVWRILTTTVGGTPNSQLQIAIPGGFTSAKQVESTHWYSDNAGAFTAGPCEVTASGTNIVLFKAGFGNWAASTDNTGSFGAIAFPVS